MSFSKGGKFDRNCSTGITWIFIHNFYRIRLNKHHIIYYSLCIGAYCLVWDILMSKHMRICKGCGRRSVKRSWESYLKEKNESQTRFKARVKDEEYKRFQSYFIDIKEGKMLVSFVNFSKNLIALRNAFNKLNTRKLGEKYKFLQTFAQITGRSYPQQGRKSTELCCEVF